MPLAAIMKKGDERKPWSADIMRAARAARADNADVGESRVRPEAVLSRASQQEPELEPELESRPGTPDGEDSESDWWVVDANGEDLPSNLRQELLASPAQAPRGLRTLESALGATRSVARSGAAALTGAFHHCAAAEDAALGRPEVAAEAVAKAAFLVRTAVNEAAANEAVTKAADLVRAAVNEAAAMTGAPAVAQGSAQLLLHMFTSALEVVLGREEAAALLCSSTAQQMGELLTDWGVLVSEAGSRQGTAPSEHGERAEADWGMKEVVLEDAANIVDDWLAVVRTQTSPRD
jgi:hypothetical protein